MITKHGHRKFLGMLFSISFLLSFKDCRVEGLSGGAPMQACATLSPSPALHLAQPQSSPPPYRIDLSPFSTPQGLQYVPGMTYNLTLLSINETSFRGFLIQGRLLADDTSTFGSFQIVNSDLSRLSSCTPPESAITHNNAITKSSIAFLWTAPPAGAGAFRFGFAVVNVRSVYWANLRTAEITEQSSVSIPDAPTATLNRDVLRWSTPLNNGANITQYIINASVVGGNDSQTVLVAVPASQPPQFSLTDSRFSFGVVYVIEVSAVNVAGMGPPSNAVFYTSLERSVEVGPWEGIRTGNIGGTIFFASPTILVIENFSYNGFGVVVFLYFYAPGQRVDDVSGRILPIPEPEGGVRGQFIRAYSGGLQDRLVIPLPEGVTACDIGTLTIWDEPFTFTFARITIPRSIFESDSRECQLVGRTQVEFEQSDYTVVEDIGLNNLALRVCFNASDILSPRNVTLLTLPESADGSDYMEVRTEVALSIGNSRQCFGIIIFEDKEPEGNETFLIAIEELGMRTLTRVTILDDDDLSIQFVGNSPIVRGDVVTFFLSFGAAVVQAKCAVLQGEAVLEEVDCSSGRAVFFNLPPRFTELTPRITVFGRDNRTSVSDDPARNFRLTIGSRRRCSVHLINEGVTFANGTRIEWGLAAPSDVEPSEIIFNCTINDSQFSLPCRPPFTNVNLQSLTVTPPRNSNGCIRGIPRTFFNII